MRVARQPRYSPDHDTLRYKMVFLRTLLHCWVALGKFFYHDRSYRRLEKSWRKQGQSQRVRIDTPPYPDDGKSIGVG